MNQSNNVKFVEADGKWMWKRYDENGSVTFRSPLFNTEREVREDYDANGDSHDVGKEIIEGAKDIHVEHVAPEGGIAGDTTATQPQDDNTAGSATNDESQEKQNEDNGVGQATI